MQMRRDGVRIGDGADDSESSFAARASGDVDGEHPGEQLGPKGGKRRIIVTPEHGEPKEYLVPKGRHIQIREGDRVRAGEKLMDGPANPHDILAVLGEKALARYLLDEIQEVYRLQGVRSTTSTSKSSSAR